MAASAILQKSNEAALQPFETKTFLSLRIDAMAVLRRASQLISVEKKDKLKPALDEDIRTLPDIDHATSE